MAKAGRPKKGSAGLPEWFDIEKYRVVKNFRAADWLKQLVCRRSLFDYIEHPDREKSESAQDALKEALNLLKADPVITKSRILDTPPKTRFIYGEMRAVVDTALGYALSSMMSRPAGVKDVTYFEIEGLCVHLPKNIRINLAAHLSLFLVKPAEMPTLYKSTSLNVGEADDCLHAMLRERGMPLATIDLSLSDEALIGEFKAYLKRWRKVLGKVSSPFLKSADFSSWYNNGVLPYLDLRLWEVVTGEPVRWAAFANALTKIADKPVGSEGALAKTTKKQAAKLMDGRTLRILQSQVLREQSGELKESGKLAVR